MQREGTFRWGTGPGIALVALTLSSFLVFFAGINQEDIHNFDSLMLSTVARIVVETGDWGTLHYPDASTPWFDHPPLGIWGIALGFIACGVTAAGARLFSAACGFGTILVTAAIGWKVRGPWAGFLSGVALMSTPYFVKTARRARLDAPLALFIALAVLGLLLAEKRRWGWVLFGLSTGLAILTKGIVGLAPLGIAPLALFLMGRWRWRNTAFWAACAISLAVAAPWIILVFARGHGDEFLNHYFVDRIWGAIRGTWPDPRGPHYYMWVGLWVGLPWFPLALWAMVRIGREAWRGKREAIPVLVWGLAILIPFSLVRHKHAYYLMPFLPAAAVAVGLILDGWLGVGVKRMAGRVLGVAFVVAGLVLPVVPIPFQRERLADLRGIQATIQSETAEEERIHCYRMPPMGTEAALAFYARRRMGESFGEPAEVREAVDAGVVRFLYLHEREWAVLEGDLEGGEVIGRSGKSVFVRFGGERDE